jgi:membrane-associated phospholipid phosphatase
VTDSWACFLQRFSTPWLDALMLAVTNMGSEMFYILVLPGIYWLWSKRAGYRIGIVYLGSVYLNGLLKAAFHTQRPVPTDCARVIHPETGPGYSFPSGHAQGSTVFWGQTAIQVKREAMRAFSVVMIALISLSRIYLNVHWPVDVIGGILIGLVILRAFNVLSIGWENMRPPTWLRVALIIGIPAVLVLVYRDQYSCTVLGFLIGLPLGSLIAEKRVPWSERAAPLSQVLKFALGMAGLFGIRYGMKVVLPESAICDIARYAVAGLWVSLGAPYLFVRLRLSQPSS